MVRGFLNSGQIRILHISLWDRKLKGTCGFFFLKRKQKKKKHEGQNRTQLGPNTWNLVKIGIHNK